MPLLLDDPITIESTPAGRPAAITWRGNRYSVRVLRRWAAGVYQISTALPTGPAIGEISVDEDDDARGKIRRWWTY